MSYDERMAPDNGPTEPINPETPQALSQSPAESIPPLPQKEKLFGVRQEEIPMILVDKECPKCFGRGFTGTYADGSVKPCVCALKELRRRHAASIAAATKSPGGAKQTSPEAPAPVQRETPDGQESQKETHGRQEEVQG